MKAVLCKAYGPPETLVVEELSDPQPGPGEVLIDVKAAALNFFDTLIIEGRYQTQPKMPFSPGAELSGIVTGVGEDVERIKAGDRVVAYLRYGACREKVVARQEDVIPIAGDVPYRIAAGILVTYGTTLHALRGRADLKPGETVAVLGASGGVGQAAVEIATLMGARVIACASSAEKLEFAKKFGASEAVNYAEEDLKTRLKELTGGAGVDVVYDPVGGDYSEQALRATAWRGRFLVIGFAAGEIPKIPLNLALLKGCDIRGVFWGDAIVREPENHWADVTQLMTWVSEGKLKPHIHAVFPLEKTAEALGELAARRALGKVIVEP